jgi:hypothetical protein
MVWKVIRLCDMCRRFNTGNDPTHSIYPRHWPKMVWKVICHLCTCVAVIGNDPTQSNHGTGPKMLWKVTCLCTSVAIPMTIHPNLATGMSGMAINLMHFVKMQN